MASTPYSTKLEKVIPLEGSNIKSTTKTGNLSFEILIRKKRNQFRAPNAQECNYWCEKIERASKLKIKDVYQFQQILGQNTSGTTKVLSAVHRVSGEEVAVKVISKKEYNPRMLQNEVLILKRLDHPHVVKLYDLFETKKSVYLVMEKCNGGELFEQIANLDGGGFSEKQCIRVLHQIAKAIKYMHSMGIVHRDLKPENILCVKPHSISEIKIADFGISKVIFDPEKKRAKKNKKSLRTLSQRTRELYDNNHNNDDEKKNDNNNSNNYRRKAKKKKFIDPLKKRKNNGKHQKHRMSQNYRDARAFELMTTMCGTISYTAPEILREQPYDKKVDYWSLGVISFILLCGYPPFYGDTEFDVAKSILTTKVTMDPEDWAHVSENGKKMVLGLLEKNPSKRKGVSDILHHSWMYASKTVSRKQRSSLMKTVAKRRIRKMSMGVFETSSAKMGYIYRSRDDSVNSPSSSVHTPSSSYRRFSRTDDDLFELRLPSMSSTPRTSQSSFELVNPPNDHYEF